MEKRSVIKEAHSFLKRYYWILLIALLFLIAGKAMATIAAVFFMIIVGAFSTYYKKYIDFSIGLELITFFTIVFLFAFGPLFAIIAAAIMTILAHLLTRKMDVNMFIRIGCYILICIASVLFFGDDFIFFGKAFVIAMNALLFLIYGFMYPYSIPSGVLIVTVNILFNFFLIENLGSVLLGLLH